MSSATFSGTVTNVLAGETLSKIEIVWMQQGIDADVAAAIAAGRALTWNAGTDDAKIAAFLAAGQLTDVGVLTPDAAYIPAVRFTKIKSDTSILTGLWFLGGETINSTAIIANFNSATIDTGFSSRTVSTGSVTSNSPVGSATISCAAANTGAIVTYDTALPDNKVFTIRVKAQYSDAINAGNAFNAFSIMDQATVPVPNTNANIGLTETIKVAFSPTYGLLGQAINASSAGMYWNTTTGTWSTLNGAWNSGVVTINTVYVSELESDGSQWRTTLYAADGTTIINQSTWVQWSAMRTTSNSLWLTVGGNNTTYPSPPAIVDSITIQL